MGVNEDKQAKEYLARVLDKTGEFEEIIADDNGKLFQKQGANSNGALNRHAGRQLFARKKEACARAGEAGDYIVVVHSEKMPVEELTDIIAAASARDIAVVNVLYRYLNDNGPLFRRNIRPEERAQSARWHKNATFRKNAFSHLPDYIRNALRTPVRLEREWCAILAGGMPLYYQPASEHYPQERLIRYRFDSVTREEWNPKRKERVSSSSQENLLPITIEHLVNFTLSTMRKRRYDRILHDFDRLDSVPQNSKLFPQLRRACKDEGKALALRLGDAISLPNLDAQTDEERALRYTLAILNDIHNFYGNNDRYHNILTRMRKEFFEELATKNAPPSYHQELADLQKRVDKKTIGRYPLQIIPVDSERIMFVYASRSRPNAVHRTSITNHNGAYRGSCSCMGHRDYAKCWHIPASIEHSRNLGEMLRETELRRQSLL